MEAYYDAAGTIDGYGWWGTNGIAENWAAAAKAYSRTTGSTPLRPVEITTYRWSWGRSFSGEPYYASETWLHYRINERTLDYWAWVRSEYHGALDVIGLAPGVGEIADGINAIGYLIEGDRVNAGISGASMVPFFGWGATGVKLGKRALTNAELVHKAAKIADAAKPGVGGVAGTIKHQYANNLLKRYESIYGSRGFEYNFSFNNNLTLGPGNSGFLDVFDRANRRIYDFKFGDAIMKPSQSMKYSTNFPGFSIVIVRP